MPERMALQGLQLVGKREIQVAGVTATVFESLQRTGAHGQPARFIHLWLMLPQEDRYHQANVSMPENMATPGQRAAIDAMFASIAVRPLDLAAQRAALPFGFQESGRLRLAEAIGGSIAILRPADAPRAGPEALQLPSLTIELSVIPVDPRAVPLEEQARSVRDRALPARDTSRDELRRVQFAGEPAILMFSEINSPTGTRWRLALWTAYTRDHYVLTAAAIAPAHRFTEAWPDFIGVIDSTRPR